jgi:hypothetical protein
MILNIIIFIVVFGAFFRAAREYGKNGFAWGFIGVAAFFVPDFLIPIVVAMILVLFGVGGEVAVGSIAITGLVGFVAAIGIVVMVYNKLMDRAIAQQAAIDARSSSSAPSLLG